MSLDHQVYDVLIVGAGPVGLATAIALVQRGITNILIIDQTRDFRPIGQVIDLLPNGLKSLEVIAPEAYQQTKQFGLDFMQMSKDKTNFWYYKNLQGQTTRSIPLDFDYWYENYGGGRVSIPWYQLQTILRNLLPPEIIQINHRCVNFSQTANSIIIDCLCNRETPISNPFAHWEMTTASAIDSPEENLTQKRLEAKLVVAVDGINSTLRKILYSNSNLEPWATPQYSGISALGCLQIDDVDPDLIQELDRQYWQGERIVTIQPSYSENNQEKLGLLSLILVRRPNNGIGYFCHLSLDLAITENPNPQTTIDSVIDICRKYNFPESLVKVIAQSNYEKLIRRPYYIHQTNIPNSNYIWSQGRLVLVGDAAHGMPPLAAQGANQGLEDAALIGIIITNIINNNNLNNLEIITEQFQQYEQIRRPFMERVQRGTMENYHWTTEEWESFSQEVYNRDIASGITIQA